jgi:CheY-like chemotaxis protein
MAEAASGAFNSDHHRLTLCESGMEALGAVGILDADLLVLDLETPGLNGLLMIGAIKELAPELPIVAVSTTPQVDARAVSHKGVLFATLSSGSNGELHESLVRLVQDRGIGLATSAGMG